jgi:tetratricopeptide (TPR) repeat protein
MDRNNRLKNKISIGKKITLMVLGLFFSLIILEIGLRVGGFLSSTLQEYRNKLSIKQRGSYRIMCLGESTTARQYPPFLEETLNKRNIGIKFSVIDKGVGGTNTTTILSQLEENLDKYHTDMVVTMMGFNDRYTLYYKDIPERDSKLFRYCRVYRFMRLVYMHILNKLEKKDIFRLEGIDSAKKTKLELRRLFQPQGKFSEAEESFRKAVELNPKDYKAYISLGVIYKSQGKFSLAEELFRETIQLDPGNSEGYSELGWLYLIQGRISESEGLFMKSLGYNPANEEAIVGLGRVYQMQGKFSEAEKSFRKAIELHPLNDFAYLGLGEVCESLNKLPESEALFKKVRELNPATYDEYVGLGIRMAGFYLTQDIRLIDKAIALFKRNIELNPKAEWLYIEIGDIYRWQGKLGLAEKFFEKALELNPKNGRTYIILGDLYRGQTKFFLKAEEYFKRAIALNPKNDWAYLGLGELYQFNLKNYPEAEVLFNKSLEFNPRNDKAYTRLGELYLIQGRISESEAAFKKALELNPRYDWTYRALESLYRGMNKIELAEEYNKKSAKLNLREYNYSPIAVYNYRKIKEILDKRGIKLVCAQYAMRSVESLKKVFEGEKGGIFVDNERIFKEAVRQGGYREYFKDMFGGNFGHCTDKGNRLLAENIANVILKEVFKK